MSGFADYLSLPSNESNIDNTNVVPNTPNIPYPSMESQSRDVNSSGFDDYLGQGESLETKMAPIPFDWEKTQADRYTQSRHFVTEGFDPYADNELKYERVQTWGDVLDRAVGGGFGLAKSTFVEGWKGWANIGNALFNWTSDQSFMQRLAGSPEELMQKDEEQKAISNKYAIFKGPEKETGFGIFNREFIGDMIQQAGFSVGAGAQFLSEMALTWGIGEGLGAVAKGAGWLAKGVEGAEDVKNMMSVAEKSNQIATTGEKINAMRKMTDPTSIKGLSKNLWDYTKDAASWSADQFKDVTGLKGLLQAKEAGASAYQLAAMGVGGVTRTLAALNTATTEARFEAANTYGQMYGDFINDWQEKHNGELPAGKDLERIRKTSYAAATDNFGANTGLLMAFNQLEFGNIMNKFGSSSRLMREALEKGEGEVYSITGKLRRDITGAVEGGGLKEGQKATQAYVKGTFGALSNFNQIRKDFGLGTALWQVGKRSGKLEVMEGLQEILQNTSDNTFRDYYKNLYDGGKDIQGGNLLKDITAADWGKGLQSQLSMEGWQTFLMGAATGLFINPMQAGVMQSFRKANAGINSQYKGEVDAHKKMLQDSQNILNTWYNDPKKSLSEHIAGIKVQGKADQNIASALTDGDKYEFNNAKDDAFTNAVAVAIKTGNYESFRDSIKEFGERLTDEQFEQAFGLKATGENKISAKAYTESIVREIEKYHDTHERLMDEFGHLVQSELYAHDPKEYVKARMAKRSLDEAIQLLATTSYHADKTIERAVELRSQAAALPSLGSSANKTFEILGNIANAEYELGQLQEQLENYKGLEKDKDVSAQITSTQEQIKHLEQWVRNYKILQDYKARGAEEAFRKTTPFIQGDTGMYNAMQKMMDAHNGYMQAINAQFTKGAPIADKREMRKAFDLLMDYDKLNRDHGNYVSALNVISDPRGFNLLYNKAKDAMYATSADLHDKHMKEIKNRISAVTGVPVEDILTAEEQKERERTGNLKQQKTLRNLLGKTEQEITDLLDRVTANEAELTSAKDSIIKIQEELVRHKEILATTDKSQKETRKAAQELVRNLTQEVKSIKQNIKSLEKEKTAIKKSLKRLEYLKAAYGAAITELEQSTASFEEISKEKKKLLKGLVGDILRPDLSISNLDAQIAYGQEQLKAIDENLKYHYGIVASTQRLIDELNVFIYQFTEGAELPEELQDNYKAELERLEKKIGDTNLAIKDLTEQRDKFARGLFTGDIRKQQEENISKLKEHIKYLQTALRALEESGLEEEEKHQTPEAGSRSPEEEESVGTPADEDKIKSEILAFYSATGKPVPTEPLPQSTAAPVAGKSIVVRINGKPVDLQKMMDEVLATGALTSYNPLDIRGSKEQIIEEIEGYAEDEGISLSTTGTTTTEPTAPSSTITTAPAPTSLSPEAQEYLNAHPEVKEKLESLRSDLEAETMTPEEAADEMGTVVAEIKPKPRAVTIDEMVSFPNLPNNPHVSKLSDSDFRIDVIDKYYPYKTVEEANAALRAWVEKNYPGTKEMTPAERRIFVARQEAIKKFNKTFGLKQFFANPDLSQLSNDDFAYVLDNTSTYEHFVRSIFATKYNKIPNHLSYYVNKQGERVTNENENKFLTNWKELITEEEYKKALAAHVEGLNKIDKAHDEKLLDLKTLTPEERAEQLIKMEQDRLFKSIKYFPQKEFYNPVTKRTSILGNKFVIMRSTRHLITDTKEQAEQLVNDYINKELAKIEGADISEHIEEGAEPEEVTTGTEEGVTFEVTPEIVERLEKIGLILSEQEKALIPYVMGTAPVTPKVDVKQVSELAKKITDSLSTMIGLELPEDGKGYVLSRTGKDQGSEDRVAEKYLKGEYDKYLSPEQTEEEEKEEEFEPEDSDIDEVVPTPRTYSSTQLTLVPFIDFDAAWADDAIWNDGGKTPKQRQDANTNPKDGRSYLPKQIKDVYEEKAKQERTKLYVTLTPENVYDKITLEFTPTGKPKNPYNIYFYIDGVKVGFITSDVKSPAYSPETNRLITALNGRLQRSGKTSIKLTGTDLESLMKFTVGAGELAFVEPVNNVYPKGIALSELLYNREGEGGTPIIKRNTDTGSSFVFGSEEDVPANALSKSSYEGAYSALIKFPSGHSYWIQLNHRTLSDAEVANTLNLINEQAAKAYSDKATKDDIKAVNAKLREIFPAYNVFEENADKKGLKVYLTLDPGNPAQGIPAGKKLGITVVHQTTGKKVEFAEIRQPDGKAVHFENIQDFISRVNVALDTINAKKTMPEIPHIEQKNMKEQVPLAPNDPKLLPALMAMTTDIKIPQVVSNVQLGINIVNEMPGVDDQANTIKRNVKQNKTTKGAGSVVEPNTPTSQQVVNPNAEPVTTKLEDINTNTLEGYNAFLDELEKQDETGKKAYKIIKGSPVFSAKSVENIDTFVKWVKEKLPQDIITTEEMNTLVTNLQENKVTVGEFIAKLNKLRQIEGVIRVAKESPFKYHEAFHSVFRLLLTQTQIDALLAEARTMFPITEKALKELRSLTPENMELSRKQLEELYLEEKMADRFDTYMMNKNAPVSPGIKGFFETLIRFVKNFFKKFTPSDLQTLFRDIDEGKYKNSTVQSNSYTEDVRNNPLGFTIPACKVIKIGTDEVVLPNGKTIEVDRHLPQKEADRLVSTITALFDQEIRNKDLKEYNSKAILNGILDKYKDTYNPRRPRYFEVQSKINNPAEAKDYIRRVFNMHNIFSKTETRNAIKDAVASSLKILGYQVTLDTIQDDKLTDTYGPRSSDKFDKKDPGASAGPEGKAQELRRFIAGTTTVAVDEFGNTHYADGTPIKEAVNAADVYNGVLKLLANTSSTDAQVEKLLQFKDMNTDVDDKTGEEKITGNKHSVAVINRFLQLTGYNTETKEFTQNQELVNLFLKGFSSYAANYLFTQLNPATGNAITTFANTKDSSVVQVQNWSNAFSRVYEDLMRRESTKDGFNKLYVQKNKAITLFRNATNTTAIAKKQNNKVISGIANNISAAFKENFGVNLHPNYIKYSILKAKNEDALTKEQKNFIAVFGDIVPIDEKILSVSIENPLSNGVSPFEKGQIVEEGQEEEVVDNTAYNLLKQLADNNSIFDETIGSISFTTSDGELRYAHTHPNFYHVAVTELNDPKVIAQIQDDVEKNTVHLLDSDEFMHLVKNKSVKLNMVEGIKKAVTGDKKEKGVVYGDFIRRENLVYMLAMYDISRRRDAKVVMGADPNEFFYKVGHLIRTVEAKKAGYVIDLPVVQAVSTKEGKTSLSEEALNILYQRVLDEVNRIAKVNKEIETGKDENGKPVAILEGYHTGDPNKVDQLRGLKLYETKKMLGDLAAEIEKNAIDSEYKLDEKAIKEQINDYWMGQVDRFIDMMKQEKLVTGDNKRALAPAYLFKGFTGRGVKEKNEKMYLIPGNFKHNIAQVFMNDFLNTSAVNRLLHGDEARSFKLFVDQVKRAAGANAAGPSIESSVTKPEWGIEHKLQTIHHITYQDTLFRKRTGKTGDQDDGQMYCTEKGLRYMLFGMGTLKQVQVDILNKIKNGDKVTKEEFFKAGGIQDMKAAFNPMKMVYFDGNTYLKCSVHVLAKEYTSYKDKDGNWQARPGKEKLHLLRNKLEKFEKANQTITFAHPQSVSKGMQKNVVKEGNGKSAIENIEDRHFNALPARYMRQQLENPSGKTSMTDPTQKLQQIFAEIPADSKVFLNGKEISGKEAVNNYLDLIAKRLANSYKMKRNAIFDLKDAFNEIGKSYEKGQITPKLTEFYDLCYDNLLATGADSQTLEFFRTKDDEIQYNLNFPATLQKYTQLFLAYFSNGALSAKIPGLTLTLTSNAHHKVVKRLISVDEEGQPKEWEVITTEMFDADPEKYTKSLIRYTPDEDGTILKRKFTGLADKLATGKPVYYLDDLRDNVGVYNEKGERVETYSEYITASHYEQADDSAVESSFSVRIPSDDKHSYTNSRRVDTFPIWMGSTGMFPQEIMEKSGTDFDLDKVYVSIPDTYVIGDKRVAYGTAITDEDKFKEYVAWQLENNKSLKAYVKKEMLSDAVQDTIAELKFTEEQQSHLIERITGNVAALFDAQNKKFDSYLLTTKEGEEKKISTDIGLLYQRRKDLLKQFTEGAKKAEELQIFIEKELLEAKAFYIKEGLKKFGLPVTLKEFIAAGSENVNNGVINNKVLQSSQSLLSSEAIAGGENPILNQPTSVDMLDNFGKMLKRELIDAESQYAKDFLDRIEDTKEDTNSMLGKEISRDTNAQGRENIGAAANAVINYSVNSTFKVPIKGNHIIIDGKQYNNYGNLKAWDGKEFNGERVFAALSAIENAMTDNAKYSYSGKYGLSIGAVGYLSNMVSQGIPFETAMLFIVQPTVQEYFKRVANIKSSIKTEQEEDLTKAKILAELEADIDIQTTKRLKKAEGTEELLGAATSRERMLHNIKNNIMSSEMLDILKVIDKQSIDLMDFSKILKITQGLPTSWEEFDDIKKAMDKFGILDSATEEKDLTIDVKHMMNNDHKFMAQYIQVFKDIDNLSKSIFVERTDEFNRLMDVTVGNFNVPLAEKNNFNKTIKNDLLSYMTIMAYKQYLKEEGLTTYLTSLDHAMIYPEALAAKTDYEDAIYIVQNLKAKFDKENTPNYFINYFLNCVDADKNSAGLNKVEANTWAKLSEYQQEKVMDGFISLYSNKETHLDAVGLFHYLLVKDGGQFKSGSFVRYIHNGIFKNLLDQAGKVNDLLSTGKKNEEEYRKVFGATSEELLDGFLKSYATFIGNKKFLKECSISADINNQNSPIYRDKETGTVYVDYKKGLPFKEKGKEYTEEEEEAISEKRKDRLFYMALNGFEGEWVETTDKKGKKVSRFKMNFPYSMIINGQFYILKSVDREKSAGEQNPSSLIQVGDSMAQGERAQYVKGQLRGSSEGWGGSGVFGKMPIRGEIVEQPKQNITNPPYSSDAPGGKEVKTKTETVVDTGKEEGYDSTTPLGSKRNPYTIAMNLKDGDGGREMRPEFKGKSTMDLILSGDRTATSRDMTEKYNNVPLKEGNYVEFADKSGRKALVQVVSPWYSIKEIDKDTWSELEGWAPSLYTKLLKKPGANYQQMEFKLVSTSKGPELDIDSMNDKDAIDTLRDQFGLTVFMIGTKGKYGITNEKGQTFTREGVTPQQMLEALVKQQTTPAQAPVTIPSIQKPVPTKTSVEITKGNYTRQEVQNNPNSAYVFTENTHSITAFPNKQGGGSAIIRPEPNAFAVVTKKKYDYNTKENVDYTDTPENFKEFVEINTKLIQDLKNSGKSKIVFPQGFATDKATMPKRFAEWLQKSLLDNFGLVTELNATKTGLISKSVQTIEEKAVVKPTEPVVVSLQGKEELIGGAFTANELNNFYLEHKSLKKDKALTSAEFKQAVIDYTSAPWYNDVKTPKEIEEITNNIKCL
jgi:hypothetical protein